MIESGIYNGFTFVESFDKIDTTVIYQTPLLNCIITGDYSAVLVKNYDTGATVHSAVRTEWQLKGQTLVSHRINYSLSLGQRLYIEIDGFSFSDHVIEYGICDLIQIFTANDCNNQFNGWESDSAALIYLMNNASQITPEFEEEEKIIINEKGQQKKTTRLIQKHRVEFYGPSNWVKFLNSLKINSYVAINSNAGLQKIYNISVEANEQDGGRYSIFVLKFEYKNTLTSGSSCCEDINIDDIISPENPGTFDCGDFSVLIEESAGTLTPNFTNLPTGVLTYKWYLNNVFISSAPSILVTTPGNYRLDARVGNCRTSGSYFKDNPCSVFDITLTKVNNDINATASNVPIGETVSYEVVLNGVTVATGLPYTALASGIYYVYATAGECKKVKGVYVKLEGTDCAFTIDIIENASTLEADTDAGTPVYLWEIETGSGRNTIGTANEVNKVGKGIYWLTVTNGSCSKSDYVYLEPTAGVVCILNRSNGTEFIVTDINLLSVTNPASQLTVFINGVNQVYVSGTPGAPNQYGIKNDGKLLVFGTLTNATIKIIYNP